MKTIVILVPESTQPTCVVDPRLLFLGVNEFLKAAGQPEMFEVKLVGATREVKLSRGAITITVDHVLDDVKHADLILVPAMEGDIVDNLKKNDVFVRWISDRFDKTKTEIASLCCGSFMLAATGLLNGKECSSHWQSAEQFREMFPEVTLVDGRIVTEQERLYSSGGASSYWNLLLYLVEKYAGREIAILAAKFYALEIDRKTQSPFVIFNGQKKHEDEPIKKAQEFIEANISDKISVEDLASKFALGRRNFIRRFKKATNNTPVEYIQRVRVEAAKKNLEVTGKNVNEVMFDAGYSDMKAFRSIFKRVTGMTPIDYRSKFNKRAY